MGAYTRTDRAEVAAALAEQFTRFPILNERRRQAAQTLSGGEQQMREPNSHAFKRERCYFPAAIR